MLGAEPTLAETSSHVFFSAQRVRETRNYFIGAPFRISDYYARLILCAKQWPLEDRLPIIPSKILWFCSYPDPLIAAALSYYG